MVDVFIEHKLIMNAVTDTVTIFKEELTMGPQIVRDKFAYR
jgi:hypothetical protein